GAGMRATAVVGAGRRPAASGSRWQGTSGERPRRPRRVGKVRDDIVISDTEEVRQRGVRQRGDLPGALPEARRPGGRGGARAPGVVGHWNRQSPWCHLPYGSPLAVWTDADVGRIPRTTCCALRGAPFVTPDLAALLADRGLLADVATWPLDRWSIPLVNQRHADDGRRAPATPRGGDADAGRACRTARDDRDVRQPVGDGAAAHRGADRALRPGRPRAGRA